MRVAMRNPTSPTGPSSINAITLNRATASPTAGPTAATRRASTPHGFDGAIGVTVPEDEDVEFSFPPVRLQAKLEPLINLRENGGRIVISTLAEVTFYGRDQAGNVSASAPACRSTSATGAIPIVRADAQWSGSRERREVSSSRWPPSRRSRPGAR